MLRQIDIDLIRARDDARLVDGEKIAAIADSIASIGLINPVRVREKGGFYELIAGNHRVEACRSLGLVDISAFIVHDDDLKAELAMIDENLCRAELSPSDRARQTARRKAIYEELHPAAKQGGAPGLAGGGKAKVDNLSSFAAETAAATGKDERTVRRDAERGEKVIDEVLDLIRGTSLDTGIYLDGLKRLPPNEQVTAARRDLARARQIAEQKARERIDAKKARRADREAELGARQMALPDRRYGVILADPEWRFETWSEAGMDRAADNHYPTSTLDMIKSRGVPSIAADDAVLLLWATAPMLPQALEVMAAWGFAYKSQFVWLKDVAGTGYWNRNQHELLLVGVKGSIPAPAPGMQFRSALAWPVGEHSAKPPFAHEIAEAYFPTLPKIELNARARRDGWDAWGLEVPDDEVSGSASGAGTEADGAGVPETTERPVRMSLAEARPILEARYATEGGQALAAELGIPVGTLRTWAFKLGLTSRARIAASGQAWAQRQNHREGQDA